MNQKNQSKIGETVTWLIILVPAVAAVVSAFIITAEYYVVYVYVCVPFAYPTGYYIFDFGEAKS